MLLLEGDLYFMGASKKKPSGRPTGGLSREEVRARIRLLLNY